MTAPNNRERILPRLIDDEIKESFINYSMSVIVSRALPDVRDGLKPVHRRVLYSMFDSGLVPGRAFKKCATVVGDVLGKYHPHGDSSVYDALVRMVQDFSLRYPLIDGQGNFGSVEGDPAAAYRYTESRLMAIAMEMLADIDKNTVDNVPNFDDSREEPSVLPAGIPNLIVNGSSGIAVGMATNIPPHSLREVVSAIIHLVDNPEATPGDLRKFVKGPDFPTGGYIYGRAGIKDYQETGRGRIIMRARAVIEEKESSNKSQIVVTEIPYQVNSAKLIEHIAELVRDKKLDGISDLRNESDKDGMRIVIELKRDAIPRVVLNQLYKQTAMQSTFGVIMLALVPDAKTGSLVPKVMPLKEILEHYITHRHTVIVRRTQFDLDKALEREHILEGLKIAVDNIDAVIKVIRAAADVPVANAQLQKRFKLTERQADAILSMRLAKLTGLEIEKLEEELKEVRAMIKDLKSLLDSKDKRMKVLKDELQEIAKKFGDERRTEITSDEGEFTIEDLIAEEEMVVTISHSGYIKRTSVSTYKKQRRGGRGNNGATLKDEDFVEHLFIASTHDYVLVFTHDGRCFWLKVHEIPQAGRAAKGKPIVNMINVSPDTQVSAIVTTRDFPEDQFLLFATKNGTVKKTALAQYSNVRATGIKAIKIEEGDELIDVQVTSGTNDIVLATRHGLSIRFHEQDVREMGRDTTGVKGIELGPRDELIGMVVIKREANLLVVTEKGLGKCSPIDEYRVQKRGGKGIITVHRTEKTGDAVSIKEVLPDDELMLITKQGVAIRMPVKGIRVAGRNTQGVRLVNLDNEDLVMDVARVVPDDETESGEDSAEPAGVGPESDEE
ncbi:MAG TPA: DNA gyrase subunit A [Gemmatimonadaceae bacterium]|jgi:DNA gyrase subunit A|nr:DNA gyrase subunit A [Gemmatimonadaceae bacterium]